MSDEYHNGRWGTGNPNYNNWEWQKGNQERLNEINRQQEAQRAAESKRIQESAKAWSNAMKPPPSPWASQSTTWSNGSGGSGGSGSSLGSGGGGYGGTSLSDGRADLTAPFRLAWALIKFAAKAIFWLIVILVLIYIARRWVDHGSTAPAAPSATTSRVPPPETPAPSVQAPSSREVAEPTETAPPAEAPSAEVPGAEELVTDPSRPARIGVWDRDFSTKDASRLALDPGINGVIIDSVLAGSPAAEIGLQPDDVIVSLNNQAVATSDGLIQLVRSQLPGAEIPIVFYRNGAQYTGSITPRSE